MINFDDARKENMKEHNPNRQEIPDYTYRILIIGGLKHFNDSEFFTEYSKNDMDDICKNNEEYNPNKKCKLFIIFYDMIADILNNKNFIQK